MSNWDWDASCQMNYMQRKNSKVLPQQQQQEEQKPHPLVQRLSTDISELPTMKAP